MDDAIFNDSSQSPSFLKNDIVPISTLEFFKSFTIIPEHFKGGAATEDAIYKKVTRTRRVSETGYQFWQTMVVAKTVSNKKD